MTCGFSRLPIEGRPSPASVSAFESASCRVACESETAEIRQLFERLQSLGCYRVPALQHRQHSAGEQSQVRLGLSCRKSAIGELER
jgi:hypothetical protein